VSTTLLDAPTPPSLFVATSSTAVSTNSLAPFSAAVVTTTTRFLATTATGFDDTCPAALTCNLNCYLPSSAKPVALPGSSGYGDDIGIPDLTMDECRQACRSYEGCEAIVHTGSGKGTCYGKKDIQTSAAEGGCQTQHPFLTEMVCGAPWGKCTLLGDPHITTFDRKMLGSYPSQDEDLYMVPVNFYNDGEYRVVQSTPLQIHGRFGYTTLFTSASSTLGVAATGPLLGGHTIAVAYVGREAQTPAYKGWKVTWDGAAILTQFPSTFLSTDKNLNATFADMEPTDFAVRARSTIGTAPGLHPSYVFELGPERSVQIYVLPGSELCNVVITMKKIDDQDGFCGNFNCDWSDDSKAELRKRGLYTPIPQAESLFPASLDSPPGWDTPTGPTPEEIMASCSPSVQGRAGCTGTAAERESCLFDACMEAQAEAVQKFGVVGASSFLGGQIPTLRGRARTIQGFAFGGSILGCFAVLYMWWSGRAGQAPTEYMRLPTFGEAEQAYSRVSLGEDRAERMPLL